MTSPLPQGLEGLVIAETRLSRVDGQRGDDDGIANGEIRDPGAPVMYQAPTAMTLTQLDAQSSTGMWYAGALAALLLISGCLWGVRRKEE